MVSMFKNISNHTFKIHETSMNNISVGDSSAISIQYYKHRVCFFKCGWMIVVACLSISKTRMSLRVIFLIEGKITQTQHRDISHNRTKRKIGQKRERQERRQTKKNKTQQSESLRSSFFICSSLRRHQLLLLERLEESCQIRCRHLRRVRSRKRSSGSGRF